MGRKPYTTKQFIKVIPGTGGIISVIARKVGCDWRTAHKYCNEYPTVNAVLQAEKESVLDLAEAQVIEAIRNGDMSIVKFYLTTIGKNRGYSERHEVSGPEGTEIPIRVISGADLDKM